MSKNVYHVSPTYEDCWTVYKNSQPLKTFSSFEEEEARDLLRKLVERDNANSVGKSDV